MMPSPDHPCPVLPWAPPGSQHLLPHQVQPPAAEHRVCSPHLPSLSREEKRRRRRATPKYRSAHATRERVRVVAFNVAFTELRGLLPTIPPNQKLSKIEILRLAICYISYLNHVLDV